MLMKLMDRLKKLGAFYLAGAPLLKLRVELFEHEMSFGLIRGTA